MQVFVSHSHQDREEYVQLISILDEADIPRFEVNQLKPGKLLAEQLREAIDDCAVCVFLATERSLVSKWCMAELGAFWGAGKRVSIFAVDDALSDQDLPPQFHGILWTSDATQLQNSVVQALREYRINQQFSYSPLLDQEFNPTVISPRAIEAFGGRWAGKGTQFKGHLGENKEFEIGFGLFVTKEGVFGTLEISFPESDVGFSRTILDCSGQLYYESYLLLTYEHVNEQSVYFGAFMGYMRPGSNTLRGSFVGYGWKSNAVVKGDFVVTKSLDANSVTNQSGLRAKKISWEQYSDSIKNIRHSAFVVEQGFTPSRINDDLDDNFEHIGVFANDMIVGALRYAKDGHIQRFSLSKSHRNFRVFKVLCNAVEQEASRDGIKKLWGHVQQRNLRLFLRVGARATGETAIFDSVEHFGLEKYVSIDPIRKAESTQ